MAANPIDVALIAENCLDCITVLLKNDCQVINKSTTVHLECALLNLHFLFTKPTKVLGDLFSMTNRYFVTTCSMHGSKTCRSPRLFAFSDLVIVPTKAGPFDIAAARPTLQIALEKGTAVRWLFSGIIQSKLQVKEIAIRLLETAKICPGAVKELGDVVMATQLGYQLVGINAKAYGPVGVTGWYAVAIALMVDKAG